MDSNLKMQLLTVLDNAGIKAAEQYIKKLSSTIDKFNSNSQKSSGSTKATKEALTGILGTVIGISKAAAKWLGIIGLVITGLQLLVKAYDKITEFLSNHFEWATKIWGVEKKKKEELKQQEELYQKQQENYKESLKATEKLYQKEKRHHEEKMGQINRETKAYIQQATTRNNLQKSLNNAELLRYERAEFEDALEAERSGASPEYLEQLHAAYEFEKNQLLLKQQSLELDRKEESIRANALQKEKELTQQRKLYYKTILEYNAADEKYKHTLVRDDRAKTDKEHKENLRLALEARDRAAANRDSAKNAVKNTLLELDQITGMLQELPMERANTMESLALQRDIAANNYDKTINMYGNQLGIEYGADYIKQINEETLEGIAYQKRTAIATESMRDDLTNVLSLKGF